MANEEHLSILKQGVEVWNQWRKDKPEIRPDFSDAILDNIDLDTRISVQQDGSVFRTPFGFMHTGADFSKANCRDTHFCDANLSDAYFNDADLSKAVLKGAYLRSTDLSRAVINGADLRDANLSEANLTDANLSEARLSRANLSKANLTGANLSEARLGSANLSEANLTGANLSKAWLGSANFGTTNLTGANLSEADLTGADIYRTNLNNALLVGATLTNAIFSSTRLSQAVFAGAKISNTIFGDVDLREVKGLEKTWHEGPSSIGVDTIIKSQGKIPEIFLKRAGVPDIFITYMKSLTGAAFDFYSCFISHSSKDQAFAERLHADLQDKGVRCWYAPEDLQIGEPILSGIDKGIRLHDKLLLVLSEHSVVSRWVEHEVEAALYEESQPERKTKILFPIRLDDTVMNPKVDWAYRIRQRHIGDFTHWKEHDAYQQAFERLLRDLKATNP